MSEDRKSPKNGQAFPLAIPAGQTMPINQRGENFYLIVATAQVNIRARSKYGSNSYTPYTQGTGSEDIEFEALDVQNTSASQIVVLIWVGSAKFIDKRLLPAQNTVLNVVNPLYSDPTNHPVTYLAIPDLSGGSFTDINGVKWLAISRVAILISNVDAGQVQLLQKTGNNTYNTGSVFAIQPATEIALAVAGNYNLVPPSGNLNCIVAEIYQAIHSP